MKTKPQANRYATESEARATLSESYRIVVKDIATGLFLTSCLSLDRTKRIYHSLFFEILPNP